MPNPSVNKYERKRLEELEAGGAYGAAPEPDAHTEAKRGVLEALVREMGDHIARRFSGAQEAPPPDAPPEHPYVPDPNKQRVSAFSHKPKNELSERLLRRRNAP
jgi:hypothetical protein